MHTPSSSPDRDLKSYTINDSIDTTELVERIRVDYALFNELPIDWIYWFASHPEHLGETLTTELAYKTGLPDVIHFLPNDLKR